MGSGFPGGLFPGQYSQGGTVPQEVEPQTAMVMTPRMVADIIEAQGLGDVVRVRAVTEIVTVDGRDVVTVVPIQETVKL
jgi:hypothetical protein